MREPVTRRADITTVGPHRDDVILEVGGRELRAFGSTGQQRSAAIALKLVELDTLAEARGIEPALLLDDVFAELDAERQRRLASRLLAAGRAQVFVTAPRPDELPAAVRSRRAGRSSRKGERMRSSKAGPSTLADALASYLRQAGLLAAAGAGRDHRGLGGAGGAADRRGHRARVGHARRRAAGAGGHRRRGPTN